MNPLFQFPGAAAASDADNLVPEPSIRRLQGLDPPEPHPHFTRLQRARGVMDPNVRSLFDEVLKRIDDLRADSSGRWERWERRFEEATSGF